MSAGHRHNPVEIPQLAEFVDDRIADAEPFPVADGDYGDVVVSSSGTVWSIDSSVITTFGRSLVNDVDAAAARTTLGLATVAATGDYDDLTDKPTIPTLPIAESDVTGLVADLAAKADLVGGLIPTSQLPAVAITNVYPVADQTAMLALTAERGDVAIRSDNSRTYILSTDSPSTLADWLLLPDANSVVSVNGQTGVVVLGAADVGAQAFSAALAAYAAGGTPSANGLSLVTAANYAAMLTLLGAQPSDTDLTAFAALSGTDVITYRAIGGWTTTAITALARTLLGRGTAALMRGDLGALGIGPRVTSLDAGVGVIDVTTTDVAFFDTGWGASPATKTFSTTGSPANGQRLSVWLKGGSNARALVWSSPFRATTAYALPANSLVNKTSYVDFVYNADTAKFESVMVTHQP